MTLAAALDVPDTAARRRYDPEGVRLVGSRCEACGAMAWPARAGCHGCGRPAPAEMTFASSGQLKTFTTMWIGPETIPAPYVIGQVRLDEGPLIFAHIRGLDEAARVPMPVRLRLASDPNEVPRFWFEPDPVA